MSTVSLVSTANAGMLIDLGTRKVLIDAFHDDKYDIYPTVTPELFREIIKHPAFSKPDYLIYTHCHPDHFSEKMTKAYADLWPYMITILPEEKADGLILSEEREFFRFGELSFSFCRLPHESVSYADVPHYGVLIRMNGLTVLDPGDCEIAAEELIDFTYHEKIDIAVLNFPWLTLRRGRQFIKEVIRPEHIIACHLPAAGEDTLGYTRALEQAVERDFKETDVRILRKSLQNELIEIIR